MDIRMTWLSQSGQLVIVVGVKISPAYVNSTSCYIYRATAGCKTISIAKEMKI